MPVRFTLAFLCRSVAVENAAFDTFMKIGIGMRCNSFFWNVLLSDWLFFVSFKNKHFSETLKVYGPNSGHHIGLHTVLRPTLGIPSVNAQAFSHFPAKGQF